MTKADSRSQRPLKRITELDGLRGIAILLVLVWHYLACQLHPAKGSALGYLSSALSLTWSGVDLFFVLSGFLIAGILLENKEAGNYFSVFYRRRVCRIFPLYYLVLGAYFAARALIGDQERFAWLIGTPLPFWRWATFTQNILTAKPDFAGGWLGVTWSLAIEEQFYLFLPLLVWLLPYRAIPPVLLVLVATAVALRVLGPHFITYIGMPWRADSLLMGALLAYGVRSRDFLDFLVSKRTLVWAMFGGMFCGTALLSTSALSPWAQLGGAFLHFWLALFYTGLLALALIERDRWLGIVLRNRVLVWFGVVSYGIYMFHEVFLGLLHGVAGNAVPILRESRDFAITTAALAVTLLVAALSFYGMERPILRWGHRARYLVTAEPTEPSNALPATVERLS